MYLEIRLFYKANMLLLIHTKLRCISMIFVPRATYPDLNLELFLSLALAWARGQNV